MSVCVLDQFEAQLEWIRQLQPDRLVDLSRQRRTELASLGEDDPARRRVVEALVELERATERWDIDVRSHCTGPICDALHERCGMLRCTLQQELIFAFLYRSRIARALVLSHMDRPDHVWEPQTTRLLVHLARNATSFVIGGAYAGDHALLVADAMPAGGVCMAFEPDRVQFKLLEHNASANGLATTLRCDGRALWSASGCDVQLVGEDAVACARPADDDGSSADVISTVTIPDALASVGRDRVDVIMLDIEGGESEALRGAESLLRLPPDRAPVLVFEVHRDYVDWSDGLDRAELITWLAGSGYTCAAIRDAHSNIDMAERPIELVPVDAVHLAGPPHGFNVMAVKDAAALEDRFFEVVPGVSPKLLAHRDPKLHHPRSGPPWKH